MYQTLVMPLKNGTQKDLKLGPDFRRDDGGGRDDDGVVMTAGVVIKVRVVNHYL
jgi:hypothetical protein